MPSWLWPALGFVVAVWFLGLWLQIAQGKFHPHALVEWVVIGAVVLVAVSAWQMRSHGQPLTPSTVTSQMSQLMPDACKDGNGKPITNNPGCPGYQPRTQPVIDARHNDPLPRPMSARLPTWMSNEMAQDRYNQCIDAGNGPTDCVHAEALYQCLKAGGSMDSCG